MIISFFLTPFIVEKLGEEAYGFIGLSNNIISYIAVFLLVFNSMYARFISIDYHNSDYYNSNLYLNSVFRVVIFFSIFLILIFLLLIPNIDTLINIPSGLIHDVSLLLFFLTLSYVFTSYSSVFSVSTYLTNRLDLSNLRNLQGIILRAFLILSLYISFDPKLYYIGLATLSSSILIFITNLRYLKLLTPKLIY